MDNLLMSNPGADKGNRQGLAIPSSHVVCNAVAQLIGWGHQGAARLKLLTDTPNASFGEEIIVKVAEDPRRKQLLDFDYRRRTGGLRTEGTVLLRRMTRGDDGVFVCKEVDVLCPTTKAGPCVVNRNAAIFLHSPANHHSLIPAAVTIAALKFALEVRTAEDAAAQATKLVEQVALFGRPGLILTGLDLNKDVVELPISVAGVKKDAEAIRNAVLEAIDHDSAVHMEKVRRPWTMVPTFTTDLDPDPNRQSKMSAQKENFDYGTDDEPLWTRSNAVLRGSFVDWFVADVSPIVEPRDIQPKLLFELL